MKKKTVALQGVFKVTLFTITFCTLSNYSTASAASIASIETTVERGEGTHKPSRRVSFPGAVTALEAADHFRLASACRDTSKAMRHGDMRGTLKAVNAAEEAFSNMTPAQLMAYLSEGS